MGRVTSHVVIERLYGDGPEDPAGCRRIIARTSHVNASIVLTSSEERATTVGLKMRDLVRDLEEEINALCSD